MTTFAPRQRVIVAGVGSGVFVRERSGYAGVGVRLDGVPAFPYWYPASAVSAETRYVVSLSSGAPSAVAADRLIQRYGLDAVTLVFCDVLVEDDDNYRFLADLEKRWQTTAIRLTDGRTPLEVGEQRQIIPNQRFAPCTYELKIKLFMDWLKPQPRDLIVALGMDWRDEQKGRLEAPRTNYGKLGFEVAYPLLEKPVMVDPLAEVRSWGIEPPRMYAYGYSHANCGGCCVKQGQSDWRRTLTHFPERYAKYEAWERQMRENPKFAPYSFLRDETGGERKAKTLEQLRLETEVASAPQLKLFALEDDLRGDSCSVECGVGGLEVEAAQTPLSASVAPDEGFDVKIHCDAPTPLNGAANAIPEIAYDKPDALFDACAAFDPQTALSDAFALYAIADYVLDVGDEKPLPAVDATTVRADLKRRGIRAYIPSDDTTDYRFYGFWRHASAIQFQLAHAESVMVWILGKRGRRGVSLVGVPLPAKEAPPTQLPMELAA